MKKITTPTIVVFIILAFAMYSYATQMAEQRTVQAFLAQRTSFVEGRCMYYDGFTECPISSDYCLSEGEIYSVNLGMCDNLQSGRAASREAGAVSLSITSWKKEVNSGSRGIFEGTITVNTDGRYLIEAGPDFEQWKTATGRAATLTLPVQLQSICDSNTDFASGIVSAKAGDTIKFTLRPAVIDKTGTYNYYIYVTNGCYKDLGDKTVTYAKSGAMAVKVVAAGTTVTPYNPTTTTTTTTSAAGTNATSTTDVLNDIKSDFSWVSDVFKGVQTKYLIYGAIALVGLFILIVMITPQRQPSAPRGY